MIKMIINVILIDTADVDIMLKMKMFSPFLIF